MYAFNWRPPAHAPLRWTHLISSKATSQSTAHRLSRRKDHSHFQLLRKVRQDCRYLFAAHIIHSQRKRVLIHQWSLGCWVFELSWSTLKRSFGCGLYPAGNGSVLVLVPLFRNWGSLEVFPYSLWTGMSDLSCLGTRCIHGWVYIFSPCHIHRDGRLERSLPKNLKGDLAQCIALVRWYRSVLRWCIYSHKLSFDAQHVSPKSTRRRMLGYTLGVEHISSKITISISLVFGCLFARENGGFASCYFFWVYLQLRSQTVTSHRVASRNIWA